MALGAVSVFLCEEQELKWEKLGESGGESKPKGNSYWPLAVVSSA